MEYAQNTEVTELYVSSGPHKMKSACVLEHRSVMSFQAYFHLFCVLRLEHCYVIPGPSVFFLCSGARTQNCDVIPEQLSFVLCSEAQSIEIKVEEETGLRR